MDNPPPDGADRVARDTRATIELDAIVRRALAEDIGPRDITTELTTDPDARAEASVRSKQEGVLAGIRPAAAAFSAVDPALELFVEREDGSFLRPGDTLMRVSGRAASILKAERTALNFLQRMSGIATLTAEFVRTVAGTHAKITDTRKTAPGLRLTDKMAVRAGGGVNHRFGLYDMVLIKDNHIAAAGGISAAVAKCRGLRDVAVEVETKNLEEVAEALRCGGVQRIMLDNFHIDALRDAVRMIGGRTEVEASGNVTLATVRAIAETGVDFISVGALTHSAPALDISLDLVLSRHTSRH
jgi:nicotinate-nucleotide pyrophosphorylase (carboxylating)